MANMSYCRYANTAHDLQDVIYDLERRSEHDHDEIDCDGTEDDNDPCPEPLSESELAAKARLIALCRQIVEYADAEDR